MARRSTPQVNAGSMADIAFLLLIFFLVTTTIQKDKGLLRTLPAANVERPIYDVKKKNVLSLTMNDKNEILANEDIVTLAEIEQLTLKFLDNGGSPVSQTMFCDYCKGDRDPLSSDTPQKAIVAIFPDRETSYETYVQVQNEVLSAYNLLRNRESQRLYDFKFTEVDNQIKEGTYKGDEEKARAQLNTVRALFPMLISEVETIPARRL